MKATVSFHSEEDLIVAVHGYKYKSVIEELDNWLRAKSKYENISTLTVEECREKIRSLRSEMDIIY